MNFTVRPLQLSHELDLRVQPTHGSNNCLEIVVLSSIAPLRHDYLELVLFFLGAKCYQNALLSLFVLQKLLVELYEVNFVAQLLEHVVKHHLFQLVKCRYVQ